MTRCEFARWLSYHLFYQGSRDRLLALAVGPAVRDLWRDGLVDRCFFVRYRLGGPHIRLRLRCRPDGREEVGARLTAAADAFFRRWPSETTLSEEAIRRENRRLLANDAADPTDEDEVYPNNSLVRLAFEPETERYGGDELLPLALDFFTLSSLHVLQGVMARPEQPKEEQLAAALSALTRLALGLAHDGCECLDLLEYATVWSRGDGALFARRGDEAYERRPEAHGRAFQRAVVAAADGGGQPADGTSWLEIARALRAGLAAAADDVRRRIAAAQIHMTANRLGLSNAEEIYLGRLLWRAARDLRASEPDLWNRCFAPAARPHSLDELIPAAFDGLSPPPPSPA